MRIYVASSWRNQHIDEIRESLEREGHECYNFKKPWGSPGFQWSDIDPNWETWTTEEYISIMRSNKYADYGFRRDRNAIDWADALVLVTPSGRSAHAEFGYAVGAGKLTVVVITEPQEPDLMYSFANLISADFYGEVLPYLANSTPANSNYSTWQQKFRLARIQGKEGYEKAMSVSRELMKLSNEKELDEDERDYYHALVCLIQEYERKLLGPNEFKKGGPVEIVKFLMEQHGLAPKDLSPEFGGQGGVLLFLQGRRELSESQIGRLCDRFGLSPSIFSKGLEEVKPCIE